LAVNSKDKKKNKWIGRKLVNPLAGHEMEIIADEFVDPKFGTGLVKLTPAHDKNDYAIGAKHNIPILGVINLSGKVENKSGGFTKYNGLSILEARKRAVEDLNVADAIEKIDETFGQLSKMIRTDLDLTTIKQLLEIYGSPEDYSFSYIGLNDQNVFVATKSLDSQFILIPKEGENVWTEVHKYILEEINKSPS